MLAAVVGAVVAGVDVGVVESTVQSLAELMTFLCQIVRVLVKEIMEVGLVYLKDFTFFKIKSYT